jgi:MFS family permease
MFTLISRVVLVALAASLSSPAVAETQPAMATPSARTQPPAGAPTDRQPQDSSFREARVVLGQLTLGTLAALTPVALAFANVDREHGDGLGLFFGSALLAPTVAGLTICAFGRLSAYEGSCLASVGGAYLGALAGGLAGYYMVGYDEFHPPAQAVGAIVGSIAGTMFGSTIAWHVSKKPRTRPPAAGPERGPPPSAGLSPIATDPELRRRSTLSSTAPGEARVIFPVLAFSF